MAHRNRIASAVIVVVACVMLDGCATVKKVVPWGKSDSVSSAAKPVELRDDSETGAAGDTLKTVPADDRDSSSNSLPSSATPSKPVDLSVPHVQRDQSPIADPLKSHSANVAESSMDPGATPARPAEDPSGNGSTGADDWAGAVQQAIHRRWVQPRGPNIPTDFYCDVMVRLTPFGGVDDVKVVRSCGDVALDASIETAVRDSSPLPTPKEPADFSDTLLLTFTPR